MSAIAAIVVLGCSAVSGPAIVGARKYIERRRARRVLAERPPLGTETPDGTLVRVTGTVRVRDTTIVAPLSGVACVAARARVSSGIPHKRGATFSPEWFAIVSFVLEREREPPVVVEGVHARLDLPAARLGSAKRGSPELARRDQLLLQLGIKRIALGGGCEEVVVTAGMRVSIAGLMMLGVPPAPPAAGELGFRDQPPATIRIVGSATYPLVIGAPVA